MAFLKREDRWSNTDEYKIDTVLKMLDEIRDRMLNLQGRMHVLEQAVNEKLPGKALTEKTFLKEVTGSDDIVGRLVSELQSMGKTLNDSIDRKLSEQLSREITTKLSTQGITILNSSGKETPVDAVLGAVDMSQDSESQMEKIRQVFDAAEGKGEKTTIVERKRMEKIAKVLQQHRQLTSAQLSQVMNLSRTRCNEYFKKLEDMGVVEPVLDGKQKFYRLS